MKLDRYFIRFRPSKVAVSADITKRYLMIRVSKEYAAYQHTFIGSSPVEELEEVVMPPVIFGMKSSSYLSLKTMLFIA